MTTQLTTDDRQQSYSQSDYAAAFAIAKQALTYVASFQTPPTPDVYEIWYRFAEGSNPELTEQLSFAVNELKSVSRESDRTTASRVLHWRRIERGKR